MRNVKEAYPDDGEIVDVESGVYPSCSEHQLEHNWTLETVRFGAFTVWRRHTLPDRTGDGSMFCYCPVDNTDQFYRWVAYGPMGRLERRCVVVDYQKGDGFGDNVGVYDLWLGARVHVHKLLVQYFWRQGGRLL